VSALVLDAGALIAVDGDDRAMVARLRVARASGIELRTTGVVVAQVWRDPTGRQANLGRLLRSVDIRAVDAQLGREAGVLLGKAGTGDPVEGTVVAIAASGDRILTSDPHDIRRLVSVAGRPVFVVPLLRLSLGQEAERPVDVVRHDPHHELAVGVVSVQELQGPRDQG
jgi:hypothetical protein